MKKQIKQGLNRLKYAMLILWLYLGFNTLINIGDLRSQTLFFCLYGSLSITGTTLWLIIRCRPNLLQYFNFTLISLRTFCIYALIEIVKNKESYKGFEKADLKQLQDGVTLLIPVLLLFHLNFKIELCFTLPLFVVASFWSIGSGFEVTGDNMTCYADPESQASIMSFRALIVLVFIYFAIY